MCFIFITKNAWTATVRSVDNTWPPFSKWDKRKNISMLETSAEIVVSVLNMVYYENTQGLNLIRND